jgi:ribosomal protein S18 acetylase RimI-like enzyme
MVNHLPLQVRQASIDDAVNVAELFLTTRRDAMPYLPTLYTDDQIRQWIAKVVFVKCAVWVAETQGQIAGFMALVGDRLEHLYILPSYQRQGIGSQLLGKAKQLSPQRLELYVFQKNTPARSFYQAHGFAEVESGDGSGNEEQEPDVRCVWTGDGGDVREK